MTMTTFVPIVVLTVLIVGLCIGGFYANAHRNDHVTLNK